MGICFGMRKDNDNIELKKISIIALRDGLSFLENYLQNE